MSRQAGEWLDSRRSSSRLAWRALAIGAAAILAVHQFVIRPWYMRWGATNAEAARTWPGDELSPAAGDVAVRAITIDAPPARIWPWIMQIGQDRAGFYSYTFLENLLCANMRNTYRLISGLQPRFVGDVVWLANRGRYGDLAGAFVLQIEPERFMVTAGKTDLERMRRGEPISGSWSWILEPIDAVGYRLSVVSRES